jgi:segregation and condensation protein B
LFVAREPISSRKLAHFAGLLDGTEARTLVRRLNRFYDGAGCAFRVEEVGGGFQLMTRARFGGWLRRVFPSPIETRLSTPAMETLAVVAYRQPVLRAAVEAVRGVDCGEILRQLMERDLVRILGRSDDLGRPYLYGTTRRFLQIFGLRHLEDLPRADILRASQIPVAVPSDRSATDFGSPAGPGLIVAQESEQVNDNR